MEELITNVNWMAVVIGAIAAYALGALWYSQKVFGKKWMQGSHIPESAQKNMMPAMFAQGVATFLLAWVIGITAVHDMLMLAALIAVTIAAIVKAGGLFTGRSNYAIVVDSSFIVVMVVVMILAHAIF